MHEGEGYRVSHIMCHQHPQARTFPKKETIGLVCVVGTCEFLYMEMKWMVYPLVKREIAVRKKREKRVSFFGRRRIVTLPPCGIFLS